MKRISEALVSCRNPDINYLDILPEYFVVWNDYPDILLSGMIIQIFCCLEWLSRYFVVWNGYPDILSSGMVIQIFCCLEWLSRYFVVWNGYLDNITSRIRK